MLVVCIIGDKFPFKWVQTAVTCFTMRWMERWIDFRDAATAVFAYIVGVVSMGVPLIE